MCITICRKKLQIDRNANKWHKTCYVANQIPFSGPIIRMDILLETKEYIDMARGDLFDIDIKKT